MILKHSERRQTMSKGIDHEYTYNLVCPYCGYKDEDAWELSDNESETYCSRCDKEFAYTRHVSISYSTSKIDSHE